MKRWLPAVLSITLLGFSACDSTEEDDPLADAIKIGAVLSTTGATGSVGLQQLQAAQLAVEEINDAGGVLGKKLALVHRDSGTDENKTKKAAQAMIDAGVPVVIGEIASALTLTAAEMLSKAHISQIAGASTSPAITTYADDGYLFRTCPSDAFQGKLLAQRAKAKDFTKVAVVHIPGAYGEGLAEAFRAAFEATGGTVTFVEEFVEGKSSYVELLGRALEGAPDAVLVVSYEVDGGTMIKDYSTSFADRAVFWFFSDAMANPDFIETAASQFTFGHEGTVPGSPSGAAYDKFASAFRAKFGEAPAAGYYQANIYDAVYLAALAITEAGSTEAVAVRDALTSVSAGGTAYSPAQFAAAVKAAGEGEDINYEGVSSTVDFDANGDITTGLYDVWAVEGGKIVTKESNITP